MWIAAGFVAVVATGVNLYRFKVGKDNKLAMALGLSFTSVFLCLQYSTVAQWVRIEDYSALLDVVVFMEGALWVFTGVLILLNVVPALLELRNR